MSLSKAQVQHQIVLSLHEHIGGPGSLVWPSHKVQRALLLLVAMMARLTLRKAGALRALLQATHAQVTPEMLLRFSAREPAPEKLATALEVKDIYDELFFVLALPRPYKRPSHLVLGAVCSLCGQLGRLRGESVEELLSDIEQQMRHVPEGMIAEFQDAIHKMRN